MTRAGSGISYLPSEHLAQLATGWVYLFYRRCQRDGQTSRSAPSG